MKDLNIISFYTNKKKKNESDNKQSEIKRKVIKQHKVGGKPMETNVKLSKCVENNRKLVKAPIDNYDIKKDRGRMNKKLIEAAPTFKQTGFTTN